MLNEIQLFKNLLISQFKPFIRENPMLIAAVDRSIKIIDQKNPQDLYELLVYLILDTTRRIEILENKLEQR